MLQEPYPELDALLEMMGEAGQHLAAIEASEGAEIGGLKGFLELIIRVRSD